VKKIRGEDDGRRVIDRVNFSKESQKILILC
jgi:hypothetical protein